MRPTTVPRLVLALLVCAVPLRLPALAQTPPQPAPPPPILRSVSFDGVTVFTPAEVRRWLDLEEGAPLPRSVDNLGDALERRYHREGYTRASVEATFDEATGALRFAADEGRIDEIALEGIEGKWLDALTGNFDVRPGDVFNSRVIGAALHRLLEPTQGGIIHKGFDLVDRGGKRVLVVELDRREVIGHADFGPGQREDWYSPVDGFSPAIGFNLTLFDTLFDASSFKQTYIRTYLTYKFARESAGYSVGFERPIVGSFEGPRVYVGAEAHEITATDDAWRLSTLEQSVVALTFANTFRDYHNRQGYQIHAAYRANPAQEIFTAWRADAHEPLVNTADYSVFRDGELFRPNQQAAAGDLRAVVLAYTLDTRGLEQESLERTYERHMFTSLFGTTGRRTPGIRFEWTSELAPEGLGGDFDFTRHIVNARGYAQFGKHGFRVRGLAGGSSGVLPPQRQFALGGIGSVHGYSFKEAAGEGMFLFNAEYRLGSRSPGGARLVAFFDAGRVWQPIAGSRDDWLKGIGGGFEIGEFRVEFGWRLDDIPKSLQVLVRFGPTF
ncbi:MAG: BamA/TamA family outer membrane protein [Vicinamibacterales bacterium]